MLIMRAATRVRGRRGGGIASLGLLMVLLIGGADAPVVAKAPQDRPAAGSSALDQALRFATAEAGGLSSRVSAWYRRTPPADRMTWAGLAACVALGGTVFLDRLWRVRRARVLPQRFVARYLERLQEGPLDRAKGLDLCDLNPSPAARVVSAALRRWGRPTVDLERATSLANRLEVEALARNLGTLRRVAAIAPLLGLLGSLLAIGRTLDGMGAALPAAALGPALAGALTPLTFAVGLAILALVAFDGLTGRVEKLGAELDRLGAETIEAMATATPIATAPARPSRSAEPAHVGRPIPVPPIHRGPHFGPIRPQGRPSGRRVEADEDAMEF